jgi:acetyltransferase-like isoleucine patch superfamily enzyme
MQLAQVESAYRHERARELMLAGATLAILSASTFAACARRARRLDRRQCRAARRGQLGARVRIGPNCIIRDSEIGADTEIHANSIIEQARVGEHCVIGPFARLRPGPCSMRHAHIGNFVEVKNSTDRRGQQGESFELLGDSHIGAGVNVGAGTVTCNYDGANKWPTVIEDGAFIGSGSMLVAPVRIGAHATIGAGSTIRRCTRRQAHADARQAGNGRGLEASPSSARPRRSRSRAQSRSQSARPQLRLQLRFYSPAHRAAASRRAHLRLASANPRSPAASQAPRGCSRPPAECRAASGRPDRRTQRRVDELPALALEHRRITSGRNSALMRL